MKKISLICFALTIVANCSYAEEHSFCKEKWGDDYRQQEYCVKKQQEAHSTLNNWNGDYDILVNCQEKWTENHEVDYRQTLYCSKKQQEALDAINIWSGDYDILTKCTEKWTENGVTDYRQIVYCSKKQQGAKDRLENM